MGRERFLVYVSLIQILSIASVSMSNAQDKSNFITLQLKKVSFEELKAEIESQSGYSFFYTQNVIDNAMLFSLNVANTDINSVLDQLEADYNLVFIIKGDKILVDKAPELFTVKGRIFSSDTYTPLVGVNILIKDTKKGIATDSKGAFKISLEKSDILEISHIGYKAQQLTFEEVQNNSFIYLDNQFENLEEILVIAYGRQTKRELTGSVEKLTAAEFKTFNTTSFDQKLQGLISGLQVMNSSGSSAAPVKLLIRGLSSISASSNPLIILDGAPLYNSPLGLERSLYSEPQNPLSLISSYDIESIEVLKDAASTSIYGSRASNGIMIITTKSGLSGKPGFEFTYNTGVSMPVRSVKKLGLANTEQWFNIIDEARENTNLSPFSPSINTSVFIDDPLDELSREEALLINNDWFDYVLETGKTDEIQLSYKQATEKSNFYVSGNYRKESGIYKPNRFKRFSLRTNISLYPHKNLTLRLRNVFVSTVNNRSINTVAGIFDDNLRGGFSQAIVESLPWYPVYNENADYWNPLSGANILAAADTENFNDEVKQYRNINSISFSYNFPFVKGLSFDGIFSTDILQNNSEFWVSETISRSGTFASDQAVTSSILNYNFLTKYHKDFGKHNFEITTGVEAQRNSEKTNFILAENIKGNSKEISDKNASIYVNSGITGERYLMSYLNRINYSFNNKYYTSVSYRIDGSSAFLPENRWTDFASVSAGWILSEEIFFNSTFINLLKIKASIGETGNQDISDNLFQTTYLNSRRYGERDLISGATSIENIGAKDLTWERTINYNIGFEFGFLENKYIGEITYFNKKVNNLLLEVPLPYSSTLDGADPVIWDNAGKLNNKGIEVDLEGYIIYNNNFRWKVGFNATYLKNKVLELHSSVDASGQGVTSRNVTLTKQGGSIGSYYLARYAGIDLDKGVEMIYEIDQDIYNNEGRTVPTGNLIPATSSNIVANRIYNKSKTGNPDFFGGVSTQIYFKRFTLDILLSFVGGYYIFDYQYHKSHYPSQGYINVFSDLYEKSWRPNVQNAEYPELKWDYNYEWDWDSDNETWINTTGNYNNLSYFTDRYLQKGDFMRLRNITLSYDIPRSILNKINFNTLNIAVSAQNLLTFTGYKGLDPESTIINGDAQLNNLSPSYFRQTPFPNAKSFNLSISAAF
ncbi:SusC/RagA family TonB-linked outer membrane protein [Chondrinema litorale]|uniref:SusC/RagA family TonB-linked outer membrane protein n=1 Tax=Chondrinema litorale TaxID=2994555 RepID=UPI002543AE6D|nr:SusC/RagA family TonB-linked outer membrane protein [Chondrinema litorale]UZR99334.1 SusC/RagA family TonB-linked outer membrane protein [Chondrinema litorale]